MDIELLGKLRQCPIALDGGKRHLRFEGRCVIPPNNSACLSKMALQKQQF
jgi:hypothetical protein